MKDELATPDQGPPMRKAKCLPSGLMVVEVQVSKPVREPLV